MDQNYSNHNSYQSNDSNADSGCRPNDSNANSGCQPNDSNADSGCQPNDSNADSGYQSNDSNADNGYQPYSSYRSNADYSNNSYFNNTYQNNYQPYGNMPPYIDNQLELEEPVKISEWVLALVLMMIPCVNIIMMFVWAFSSTEKKSKSNFFKAYLIFFGIGLALAVLIWFGIIFFAALALS